MAPVPHTRCCTGARAIRGGNRRLPPHRHPGRLLDHRAGGRRAPESNFQIWIWCWLKGRRHLAPASARTWNLRIYCDDVALETKSRARAGPGQLPAPTCLVINKIDLAPWWAPTGGDATRTRSRMRGGPTWCLPLAQWRGLAGRAFPVRQLPKSILIMTNKCWKRNLCLGARPVALLICCFD